MAAPRLVVDLTIGKEDMMKLMAIARSRTGPASQVERARMLLAHRDEPSSPTGHDTEMHAPTGYATEMHPSATEAAAAEMHPTTPDAAAAECHRGRCNGDSSAHGRQFGDAKACRAGDAAFSSSRTTARRPSRSWSSLRRDEAIALSKKWCCGSVISNSTWCHER